MPTFYDLMKYAATGIASPEMSAYDKARALAVFGGGAVQTLTDVPPLIFRANGKPLISWSMSGNGSQSGTPTPDAPIQPEFVGTLSGANWTIPITCAGQTSPVYLGQTQTVRRIKKLVLTGEENWDHYGSSAFWTKIAADNTIINRIGLCNTYKLASAEGSIPAVMNNGEFTVISANGRLFIKNTSYSTAIPFKEYLAQQHAAGTPVCVWYVLAEPSTGIINEPLCKIGDYADELHSSDTTVSIPTAKGQNTLTVESELQPSEMTITYKS